MARTQLVRKVYDYEGGESGRSAKPNATVLNFEFLAPEKDENDKAVVLDTRTIDLKAFAADNAEMAFCAMAHGLSQKLGDELAGIDGKAAKANEARDDERGFVDFALSLWDDMFDNITSGVWVEEGEGSSGAGNVTVLLEAIVAAFADAGTELDDAQKAGIRASLKDEAFRKAAKARPDVAAHVADITAKRAAERAAKAKEKAAAATDMGDLNALLGNATA